MNKKKIPLRCKTICACAVQFYIIFLCDGIHNIPLLSAVMEKRVSAPEAHKSMNHVLHSCSERGRNKIIKSARFAGTFSSRAQLASLASLSAPRARDSIVALRAPEFLNVALRARSCALRIHLSLFLIFWYWSSNQFYNNITDDVNYTFSQSHWLSFWI